MKFPVSAWSHAVLFGTLWGAAEATAGVALKAAGVPLSGLLLAAAGLVCAVTVRRLQPTPGVVLAAGAVAALLRAGATGAVHPGPVVAILLEALAVEAAFGLAGNRAAAALLGGAAAFVAAPVQAVVTLRIVAGRETAEALTVWGDSLARSMGVPGGAAALFGAVVLATGVAGGLAGRGAWRIAGRVLVRLGRTV